MSLSPEQFAYLWFGSLLVLWVGYLVYLATRRPYSIWENILFSPIYTVCRLLWRVELMTPFPLDAKQGALMIANHRCSLDPFFLQMLPQRRVHWMVAKEYCEHPVMGVALKLFQAIPTNRGGMDTGSTKLAIRYAEKVIWWVCFLRVESIARLIFFFRCDLGLRRLLYERTYLLFPAISKVHRERGLCWLLCSKQPMFEYIAARRFIRLMLFRVMSPLKKMSCSSFIVD
jgi:hypothetical protein